MNSILGNKKCRPKSTMWLLVCIHTIWKHSY
nr:MAG TPA_asm: hypothetical protein [Caudoviricetes sp.]